MKTLFIVVSATLVLAGCQVGGSAFVRDATGVDKFVQLEGAGIVLKQELQIAAGKARVFLQNGRVSSGFDSYQPHCAFEIASVRHAGVSINPDTFVISKVQRFVQPVVEARPMQVAGLWLAEGLAGGAQSYYDGYHFWLTSADQPQVRRMSCFGVYAQPYELYPPTMVEIRQALGSLAEIRQ